MLRERHNPPVWAFWLKKALVAAFILCTCAPTLPETLWQLGQFDRSSAEFRPWINPITRDRVNYSDPASDPVFVIGQSLPARDWPAYQPGSANGGAGFREHPFSIEFELRNRPTDRCRLNLGLLAYSARLPVLEIQINGRKGWFYQDPKLNYDGGDSAVFFIPYYSTAEVIYDFPNDWLQPGRNRIVLTAIDEPSERDDTRPSGFPWPGSSGVHYDTIRLETFESEGTSTVITVAPTIFYQSQPDLRERVDVFVTALLPPKRIILRLGDYSWTNRIATDRSYGQWRSEFFVPAFSDATNAKVSVDFGNSTNEIVRSISPARKWTLFAVPNIHVDVGYTDYAPKVSEIQSRILDQAIDLGASNPDFRFTPDGFWPVEEFLHGRSNEQRRRLTESIRRGTISIPAVHSSTFSGFSSLENLIRLLYPSKRFAIENNVPFEFALNTDVPSYSWSLVSVLAASGVPLFVGASDAYRAPFLLYNRYHEVSPHWWEGPDGRRVLTWYARHYHQLASLFGLPYNLANGRDSIPRFLQAYDRPDYRSDAVIIYGSQVENVELHPGHATLVKEWNSRYAYPRLQYGSFPEALRYITNQTGTNLPILRGDGGPYWEDGLGANARTVALARSNMYRILSAEKVSTIAHLANPRFLPEKEILGQAWRNLLLIDEHTWHADQSVREPLSQQSRRQGELKDSRTLDAQRQIEHVALRGFAALANEIQAPAGSLVVFNSLGWLRTGPVQIDLPRGMTIYDPEREREVLVEILSSGNAFDHVRFEAVDIPGVGYKCYSLQAGAISTNDLGEERSAELTNRFYSIKLDPKSGRVLSIVDRELARELVEQNAAFGLNEYLYVTGGDDLPNRLVQYSTVSPLPALETHRASASSRLLFVKRFPHGMIARIESSCLNSPRIETDIFLPDSSKRIEFVNRVVRTYTLRKEGVYFTFPFNLSTPRFKWATQNGFVDPTKDLLKGACREWFLAHQWVSVRNDEMEIAWVPVDAPLFTVGDIVRGSWPQEFGERPATVFSYVMNNYTPEGYQAGQEGEHTFRYVLTSGKVLEPALLHRLGMEALTPLETIEITRNDKSGARQEWLPWPRGSFLEIDSPNLSLMNWKMAEFGEGTILRLLETADQAGVVNLRFPWHRIDTAFRCTAVEDELEPLTFDGQRARVQVRPHEIMTLKLRLTRQDPAK